MGIMEDAERLANPAIEQVWTFGRDRITKARVTTSSLRLIRDDDVALLLPGLTCGRRNAAALAASIVLVSARLGDPRKLEDLVAMSISLTAERRNGYVCIRPVIYL